MRKVDVLILILNTLFFTAVAFFQVSNTYLLLFVVSLFVVNIIWYYWFKKGNIPNGKKRSAK